MLSDDDLIRDLIADWHVAMSAGDTGRLLELMAEDAVFLATGEKPVRGRQAFVDDFGAILQSYRIVSQSDIHDIAIGGDLGYCWHHMTVTASPLEGEGSVQRTGDILSIFRKVPDGSWRLWRDANMLGIEESVATEEAKSEAEPLTDKLTDVANRTGFDRRLVEESYRSERYPAPLSLLLIDIDHFKQYNEEHGHLAGDEVMRKITRILQMMSRPSDFIARFSSEELAMLLPSTPLEGSCVLAERIRKAIADNAFEHGRLTVSIGAATLPRGTHDRELLVAAAEKALASAKRAGRNRTVYG